MRSRLSKRAGILGVVIGSLLVGTSVLAQSPFAPTANPITAVLDKLDQIIGILTAPPPPPPGSGPVVLSTPLVSFGALDLGGCLVTNVGTETIARIDVRMVNAFGTVSSGFSRTDLNVQPGHSGVVAYGLVGGGHLRCEFSFDGTAAAVRAVLSVTTQTFQTVANVDAR